MIRITILLKDSESLTMRWFGLAEGFTDDFIDRLFELVETSRNFDEELNYAVIRLIVCVPTSREREMTLMLTGSSFAFARSR